MNSQQIAASIPPVVPLVPAVQRRPRLLWANVYCLLDHSSGASMAVRQMLLQLVQSGWEVSILGATVFDHERGTAGLQGQWPALKARRGALVSLVDGVLEHRLFVTASTHRDQMQCWEEGAWYSLYQQALEQFRPDMVFYYGGKPFDFLIAAEARACGIPAVFYLANGSYRKTRFCRDVDLLLTDSQATADLYARRLGVAPVPVGAFIDPVRVVAQQHARERVLFVNPRPEKGAAIVVRLAMLLERCRPDIVFEVVESRGGWAEMLRRVSGAMGSPREVLDNVVVTPTTEDMRPVYGRARVLLAPSLWWESAGRVVAEAMLNGIPAIITDNGGMPEMMHDGGIVLKLDACFHKDLDRLPPDSALEPVLQHLEALFDDEAQYAALSRCAAQVGRTVHSLQASTARLLQALAPLAQQRCGDADAGAAIRQLHRHGQDDRTVPQ